jgi:alpha-D-ribose 1-methylphosphonate 5-triphosphate diphosphatase
VTETILRNASVVLPDEVITGSVVVRDGLIRDLDTGDAGRSGEDLEGDYLLPGLVELHTDHLEYHFRPRPGTEWDPIPAVLSHDAQLAASGVTTVLDALRVGTDPGQAGLDRRDKGLHDPMSAAGPRMAAAIGEGVAAGILRADHYLHLRCEVPAADCIETFDAYAGNARVLLVSLMDHTPGERQYAAVEYFRRYAIGKGRVTEDGFDAYVQRLQDGKARFSEPNRVGIADRVRERGLVLATHDDATVEHVEHSVKLGGTISEFPTTVAAAQAAVHRGQQTVMGAPNLVRGGSQSGNVSAAEVLGLGLLNILSSDYVPSSPLQAVFFMTAHGMLPIEAAVRLVSANPARAVRLDDRGEIVAGQRADLVRVRPHAAFPVVRGVWRAGRRVC